MAKRVALPKLDDLWQEHTNGGAAADSVLATLREAILQGRLKPGNRLPEAAIAEQFGISRTPVREAVLRLEAERLATRVPRRGLVVRAFSEQEVLDFFSVRVALEGLAGRVAAERARPADIRQLRWINQQFADAVKAGSGPTVLDDLTQEFHSLIYQATRNTLLRELMDQVNERVRQFSGSTFTFPGWAERVIAQHIAIIDAIEAGDGDLAERLLREHKLNGQKIRLAMLDGSTS